LEVAHRLRSASRILVAWGDCAVFGGVNTLRNWIPKAEVLRRGYVETESTVQGIIPLHDELPPLLDKVLPVNHVVTVDAYVPGCPPSPEVLAYSLESLLLGRNPILPNELMHFD
jgi:NAD-reducing hydrogenase small subunit